MSGICYQCGKRLFRFGRTIEGVVRMIDGNLVKLHKVCAKTFDNDQRKEIPTPKPMVLGSDD